MAPDPAPIARRRLAALLLVPLAVAGGAAVPAAAVQVGTKTTANEREPERLCGDCKTTGKLGNELKGDAARLEEPVLRCSVRIDRDPAGLGLPFVPCRSCTAPAKQAAARAEFDGLAAEVRAWRDRCAAIEADLSPRAPLAFVETRHFFLVYGLPRVVTSTRETFLLHEGAHLYARRLEEFYAWYQELLGVDDARARVTKHQIFLLDDLRTLVRAAPRYADVATDRSGRKVGDPSVFVTWRDKNVYGRDDGAFHRHVVHSVAHLMTGVHHLKVWLADDAGWLDEGLAHVAEMRRFGSAGNTCNTEGIEEDLEDGDWRPLVLKRVQTNALVPFADFMRKRSHELEGPLHPLCWSYTDFLLERDRDALLRTIESIKEKKGDVRELLRENFGLTTVGIDAAWAEWVRETYAPKR